LYTPDCGSGESGFESPRSPQGVLGSWLAQRPVKPSRRESPWGFESLHTHRALVAQGRERDVPSVEVGRSNRPGGTHAAVAFLVERPVCKAGTQTGSIPDGGSRCPSTVELRRRALAAQPPLIRVVGPVRHRGLRLARLPAIGSSTGCAGRPPWSPRRGVTPGPRQRSASPLAWSRSASASGTSSRDLSR
jgi:hypothetical protein